MTKTPFRTKEPKILYFGTPVAVISSLNEDGTRNLAPMSSFWALGWTIMLGLLDETKTAENLARHPECVCPVQMEAKVHCLHRMEGQTLSEVGGGVAAEVEIVRVHVTEQFIKSENHIDPAKWSPLLYNFRHYFRLSEHELGKTFRAES
jgi:flavin reductase (DIM6/NTAB) family NADH-FMN oxidoreductase RutF